MVLALMEFMLHSERQYRMVQIGERRISGAWRIPWTEKPGGLHSPWVPKKPDMTEQLSLSLSFR